MANPQLLYLLFFMFLLPLKTFAQNNNNGTIAVGSTFTATAAITKPWVLSSPSGDFAFGFQKLKATDELMLCIWYAKLPEPTVVWHANTSAAIPGGSSVRVDADFGLILRDPQGNKLWTPDAVFNKVDHGFLNDTGSFVLVGNDSTVVWDSFAHPTDTLLPTQEMDNTTMLISRRSEANYFSQGRFYLRMLDNGNLVLSSNTVPTFLDYFDYYHSQTSDPLYQTNPGYKLIFSNDGTISILKRSNEKYVLHPSRAIYSEYYLRLSLNFDGVLSLYSIPKNSTSDQNWTSDWAQPGNICLEILHDLSTGACGYNNVCSLDANTKRPSCKCPQHFSLLDPSDEHGSCKPNFLIQPCDEPGKGGSSQDLYDIIEIPDTNWGYDDIEYINLSDKYACKDACTNDCLCDVAVFGNTGCYKKRMPSYGIKNTSDDAITLLKVGKADYAPPSNPYSPILMKKKDRGALIIVGSVILGSSVFINFLFITATCLGFFFLYKRKIKNPNTTRPPVQSHLHGFLYKELAEATDGFKEEIGRGASAIVYKGEMPMGSGNIIVAVKKLDRVTHDSEKEFKAEVNVIGQTHHKHLVRLLGYCTEGQHQLLVYEYMSNGSLSRFLFDDLTPSWTQRTKIALGIARGLTVGNL